jgi:hypothetical protein
VGEIKTRSVTQRPPPTVADANSKVWLLGLATVAARRCSRWQHQTDGAEVGFRFVTLLART